MQDIYILAGARTPVGVLQGLLSDVSAIDLGVVAARGAIECSGVDPALVDQVVLGNVIQTSKDAIYFARHVALKRGDLSLSDVDRVEVNEAFSAQYLAVEKELGLERDKTNVNGGAISIGHPLAASGARLTITLMNELRRNHLKYGVASLCLGGGQGIAAVIENVA